MLRASQMTETFWVPGARAQIQWSAHPITNDLKSVLQRLVDTPLRNASVGILADISKIHRLPLVEDLRGKLRGLSLPEHLLVGDALADHVNSLKKPDAALTRLDGVSKQVAVSLLYWGYASEVDRHHPSKILMKDLANAFGCQGSAIREFVLPLEFPHACDRCGKTGSISCAGVSAQAKSISTFKCSHCNHVDNFWGHGGELGRSFNRHVDLIAAKCACHSCQSIASTANEKLKEIAHRLPGLLTQWLQRQTERGLQSPGTLMANERHRWPHDYVSGMRTHIVQIVDQSESAEVMFERLSDGVDDGFTTERGIFPTWVENLVELDLATLAVEGETDTVDWQKVIDAGFSRIMREHKGASGALDAFIADVTSGDLQRASYLILDLFGMYFSRVELPLRIGFRWTSKMDKLLERHRGLIQPTEQKVKSTAQRDEAASRPFSSRTADELSPVLPLKAHASRMYEQFLTQVEADGQAGCEETIKTGCVQLDDRIAGVPVGGLTIIAEPPGGERFQFMLNMANWMATEGGLSVLLFSNQRTCMEMTRRIAALRSGVRHSSLLTGKLMDHDWKALLPRIEELHAPSQSLWLDDEMQMDMGDLTQKAYGQFPPNGRPGVIMIDSLKGIGGMAQSSALDRQLKLDQMARELKYLARELRVAIIATADCVEHPDGASGGFSLPDAPSLMDVADLVLQLDLEPLTRKDGDAGRGCALTLRKGAEGLPSWDGHRLDASGRFSFFLNRSKAQ